MPNRTSGNRCGGDAAAISFANPAANWSGKIIDNADVPLQPLVAQAGSDRLRNRQPVPSGWNDFGAGSGRLGGCAPHVQPGWNRNSCHRPSLPIERVFLRTLEGQFCISPGLEVKFRRKLRLEGSTADSAEGAKHESWSTARAWQLRLIATDNAFDVRRIKSTCYSRRRQKNVLLLSP
jgi:hypothetical protein